MVMEKLDYPDHQDRQVHQEHVVKEVHQEQLENRDQLDLREAPVSKEDGVLQELRVKVEPLVHPEVRGQSVTKDDKERQVQPARKVHQV